MNESENVSDPDLEDDEEEVESEDNNETFADWHDVSGDDVMEGPKRLMFATREFHGSLLIPGTLYSYAFIFADALELAALEENDTWDLESVSGMESVAFAVSAAWRRYLMRGNLKASCKLHAREFQRKSFSVLQQTDKVPFRADSPPSRGRVIVTPLQGRAFLQHAVAQGF